VYAELDQVLTSIEHPPVQRSAGQELDKADSDIVNAQHELASLPDQLRALDIQAAEVVARFDAQKASLESRRTELQAAVVNAQERRQEALRELTAARTEGPQPAPEQTPPQNAADETSSARRASQFAIMWELLRSLKELPALAEHAQLHAFMGSTPVGSPTLSAAGSNADSVPFSPLDAAERSASEQPEAARSKPQRGGSQRDGVTKLPTAQAYKLAGATSAASAKEERDRRLTARREQGLTEQPGDNAQPQLAPETANHESDRREPLSLFCFSFDGP
jgi:hypothetical protein